MSGAPVILAAACTFPSGPTIALADAAVRAQLSLLQRHPDYLDQAGERCRGSFFPLDLPFDAGRWGVLAKAVLDQLANSLGDSLPSRGRPRPCALWLVLPDVDNRPGMPADLLQTVTSNVQEGPFRWERVVQCPGGHAAGIAALHEASGYLRAHPQSLVVVLGVESGLAREAMFWLDMQSLLHGTRSVHRGETRTQPYGRVPGEGAAAVALTASIEPGTGWARLLGTGIADEPAIHASGDVCIGAGLSRAARDAIDLAASYGPDPIGSIMADLNGEPYRADQFGFTAMRLSRRLAPQWRRSVPALASGDLNAASSVAHVALAAYAARSQPGSSPQLILASSDDPLRAAAVVGAFDLIPKLQEACA